MKSDVIESLSLQLVAVGAAVLLGWLMRAGLACAATRLPGTGAKLFESFPLFPLCMLNKHTD